MRVYNRHLLSLTKAIITDIDVIFPVAAVIKLPLSKRPAFLFRTLRQACMPNNYSD